jgi:uncharacterized protein (DUF4415 family)
MKRRTGVTKGRRISGKKVSSKLAGQKTTVRKIARLRASAGESKRSHDLIAELEGLYKPIKKPVTLRLDADVLDWFKKQGHGYQTRINRALRNLMMDER